MHITGATARLHWRSHRPSCERLDERTLLSGLGPATLTSAYGLNAISFTSPRGSIVNGDGTGETVALVEAYHDRYISTDLQTFDRSFGLPDPTLTVVNQAGAASDDDWALEETLDVEWAHAIAPGANILVVEARSQSLQSLMTAVNTARNAPGAVAVSMSWGFNEFRGEPSYNATFETPSGHTGITFLAASGDSGARSGPEWPAVVPSVVGVGGTTLDLAASGQYQAESPWSGTSGGYSRYEAEPAYQRPFQATGRRSSPDVAFDGDPNTGVLVYETDPDTLLGSWQIVGGTSLGTPAWAAIIAIADQGRALAGEPSLDGATQSLPALYALPTADFKSVASYGRRGQAAAATANTSTGRGTPDGQALVDALVANIGSTPLDTSSATRRPVRHTQKVRVINMPKRVAQDVEIVAMARADKRSRGRDW
jgi:subtilase family serine protease